MQNKNAVQLINNIIGQLTGVKKMMEEEKKCVDIIPQIKASRAALSSLLNKYVVNNAELCISDLNKNDKESLLNLIKELSR